MDLRTVVIAPRFHGPPGSANGGYSCGLVAAGWPGPTEVTLRRPPPLATPMRLAEDGDVRTLWAGSDLIAEARRASLALDVPAAPSFDGATELATAYVGREHHFFPTCFVCGPARAQGDGLRIFPGRRSAGDPVAAPWVPDASLAQPGASLPPEIVWAALDCPGYFGVAAPDHPVALLGRMTCEIVGDVRVGDACVVVGWALGRDGRKLHAGTALFGADGALVARARQTWIVIGPPAGA